MGLLLLTMEEEEGIWKRNAITHVVSISPLALFLLWTGIGWHGPDPTTRSRSSCFVNHFLWSNILYDDDDDGWLFDGRWDWDVMWWWMLGEQQLTRQDTTAKGPP